MSERGEYRAIYTVLQDGPDFQRLSPEARLTFYTCKLSLGPSGIDVVSGLMSALSERTGYDHQAIVAALAELSAAGWIKHERNVLWVVDGLRFEPSLSITNAKHRMGVRRHIGGLPRLDIVEKFRQRYAGWLGQDSHDNGYPKGIPAPAPIPKEVGDTHGNLRKTEDGRRKTETEPSQRTTTTGRADLLAAFSVDTSLGILDFLEELEGDPKKGAAMGTLRMWAGGHGMPPTQRATPDEIAAGILAFRMKHPIGERNPQHYAERYLWNFIARVVERRTNPQPPSNGAGGVGKPRTPRPSPVPPSRYPVKQADNA